MTAAIKHNNHIDVSRRDRAINAVACPLCGAEVGEPCTGWKDPGSHALHNQRWLAAKVNQTDSIPKAMSIGGQITTSPPRRVSDPIFALVVVEAKTYEIDALVNQHGFRWTPKAHAYVRIVVADIAAAKALARALFDDGYAVKLHPAKPSEILCWQQNWSVHTDGPRATVRKFNR